MSGERNPYKEAKLGVFQESAWVDMLLAEAYPTKDINVLKTYERNLLIKDGRLYENMLPNLGRRTMGQKVFLIPDVAALMRLIGLHLNP